MAKKRKAPTKRQSPSRAAKQAEHSATLTPKQAAFLAAYRDRGVVSDAARAAKVNRTSHYEWLESSPAYVQAFAEAQERLTDLLLDEAVRRAFAGSDRLLEFLLKGLKPEVFNRQRVEIQASGGTGMMAVWQMSDDELDEEIRRYRKICD